MDPAPRPSQEGRMHTTRGSNRFLALILVDWRAIGRSMFDASTIIAMMHHLMHVVDQM